MKYGQMLIIRESVLFLHKQIKQLGSIDVDIESGQVEHKLYDALKKIKWLKVVNAFVVGFIQATNIGV